MSEDQRDGQFSAAEARVDAAIGTLEASLRSLNGRVRSLNRIGQEVQKLETERAKLSTELRIEKSRAQQLDIAAEDVSRRLVKAMDTVRSVLATGADIAQDHEVDEEQLLTAQEEQEQSDDAAQIAPEPKIDLPEPETASLEGQEKNA